MAYMAHKKCYTKSVTLFVCNARKTEAFVMHYYFNGQGAGYSALLFGEKVLPADGGVHGFVLGCELIKHSPESGGLHLEDISLIIKGSSSKEH